VSPVRRTLVVCTVFAVIAIVLLLWMESWVERVVEIQAADETQAPEEETAAPALGVQILESDGTAAVGAVVSVRWRSGEGEAGAAQATATPTNIVRVPLTGADDRSVLVEVSATLDGRTAALAEADLVRVRPDGRVRITLPTE
jgi:hypothetical protein